MYCLLNPLFGIKNQVLVKSLMVFLGRYNLSPFFVVMVCLFYKCLGKISNAGVINFNYCKFNTGILVFCTNGN